MRYSAFFYLDCIFEIQGVFYIYSTSVQTTWFSFLFFSFFLLVLSLEKELYVTKDCWGKENFPLFGWFHLLITKHGLASPVTINTEPIKVDSADCIYILVYTNTYTCTCVYMYVTMRVRTQEGMNLRVKVMSKVGQRVLLRAWRKEEEGAKWHDAVLIKIC